MDVVVCCCLHCFCLCFFGFGFVGFDGFDWGSCQEFPNSVKQRQPLSDRKSHQSGNVSLWKKRNAPGKQIDGVDERCPYEHPGQEQFGSVDGGD